MDVGHRRDLGGNVATLTGWTEAIFGERRLAVVLDQVEPGDRVDHLLVAHHHRKRQPSGGRRADRQTEKPHIGRRCAPCHLDRQLFDIGKGSELFQQPVRAARRDHRIESIQPVGLDSKSLQLYGVQAAAPRRSNDRQQKASE